MPTDGKFVEVVGNYNPTALDQPLAIEKDRVEYWISKGAKPTNTVAKLLNKQGFTLPVLEYHKAPKKVAKPAETVPTVAPVAPAAAEKPKEEPTKDTTGELIVETTVAPEAEKPVGEAAPIEEKKEEILNNPPAGEQHDENKEVVSVEERPVAEAAEPTPESEPEKTE